MIAERSEAIHDLNRLLDEPVEEGDIENIFWDSGAVMARNYRDTHN